MKVTRKEKTRLLKLEEIEIEISGATFSIYNRLKNPPPD